MATFIVTGPDGKKYRVTGDGTAQDALQQVQRSVGASQPTAPPDGEQQYGSPVGNVLRQSLGLPTVPEKTSVVGDVAKSGASGVARGAADLLGLPGTIGDALHGAGEWALRSGYQAVTGETPQPGTFFGGPKPEYEQAMPLSGQKLRGVASYLSGGGSDYQPKTTPGEYARTAGEFLPSGVALGGFSAPSLLGNVALPAASSETAGQFTKGTALEPYARLLGALAGGWAGSAISKPKAATLPTADEIKASAGYQDLKAPMQAAKVDQPTYQGIIKDLRGEANDFGLTTKLKGEVSGTLNDFTKRAKGGGASLYDLEVLRRSLRNIGGDRADQSAQALSGKLVGNLDNAVENLSASNIAAGAETGTPVLDVLKNARETYRTGMKSQMIENAMENAKNAASGYENGLRIEFRKLLKPENVKNFTDGERKVIEQVARGTLGSNALRWFGGLGVPVDSGRNFLGSMIGGGLGAKIGFALGGPTGAVIGGPALMGAGTLAKLGANAATRNSAQMAESLVKAGPNAGEQFARALAASKVAGKEGLLRALLQSQSAVQVQPSIVPVRQ